MGTKREIGSAIKDQLNSLNQIPSDQVWRDLEVDLHKKKKRRILPFWFWMAGIGILFIGFVSGGYYFSSFSNSYSKNKKDNLSIVESDAGRIENKLESQNQKDSAITDVDNNPDVIESDHIVLELDKNVKNKKSNTTADIKEKENRNPSSHKKNNLETQIATYSENYRVGSENDKNNFITQEIVNSLGNDSINEHATLIDTAANALTVILEKKRSSNKKKKNKLLLETQEDNDSLKSIKKNPWSVSVSAIINMYDIFKSESLIDKRLDGNQVDRNIHVNYGIALHHNLYNRWTLRIGANLVKYDQLTRNIDANNINFQILEQVRYTTDEQSINNYINSASDIEIRQDFTYLEIPLQARYSIVGNKIDLATIIGVQNRFVLEDRVFLTSDLQELQIGESNSIYNFSVSAHLSLASRVKLFKDFYFNIEPAIYYHLQPFETDGVSLPTEFRVTSSLEYKF